MTTVMGLNGVDHFSAGSRVFWGPATYRVYRRDEQNSVSILCILHDHVVRYDIIPLLSPFE